MPGFTKVTDPTNNISNLANQPVESPAVLKQKFDEIGQDLKAYLNNTLTVELESTTDGDSGLDNIGMTPVGIYTNAQTMVEHLEADKTPLTGNHLGTWQGYSPVQTDPGIQAIVNEHTVDILDKSYSVRNHSDLVIGDDWTNALQAAIDNTPTGGFTLVPFDIKIRSTIKLRNGVGLKGVGQSKIIADYSSWIDHSFGIDIPLKTALWVEPRPHVFESELNEQSITIGDFVLVALNDSMNISVGMYLGMEDTSTIIGTTVNDSVVGKTFSNISIQKFNDQLVLSEAWDCSFNNLIVTKTKNFGIHLKGQSVNNVFTSCKSYGGINAIRIEGRSYSGTIKRPEGIVFNGGFSGAAEIGINHLNGLYVVYSHLIVDLNSVNAFKGASADDVVVSNCYLYASGATVELSTMQEVNNNALNLIGNFFVGTETSNYAIGNANLWSGVNIIGNTFTGYANSACIFLGVLTQAMIDGNTFKNNTVAQCIVASSTSKPTLGFNTTTDNNSIITNQGTDHIMHRFVSDVGIYGNKIIGNTGNLAFTANGLDVNLNTGLNMRLNNNPLVPMLGVSDLNTILGTVFFVTVGGTGSPGAGIWYGTQIEYDTNAAMQEVVKSGGIPLRRFKSGGVWGGWY